MVRGSSLTALHYRVELVPVLFTKLRIQFSFGVCKGRGGGGVFCGKFLYTIMHTFKKSNPGQDLGFGPI